MADYWKSIPKYWCKHCKQYVRDTPLEKRNHESSPRHQGNLQRFLKELHKTNDRETREAQRAKDEVARLKGNHHGENDRVQPGESAAGAAYPVKSRPQPAATVGERQRQMAQLAAMGVVVPEEYRKENAMFGEWEILPVQPVPSTGAKHRLVQPELKLKIEDDGEKSPADGRPPEMPKRKADGDMEEQSERNAKKPNWGNDIKTHEQADLAQDLESLIANSSAIRPKLLKREPGSEIVEKPSVNEQGAAVLDSGVVKEDADDNAEEASHLKLNDAEHGGSATSADLGCEFSDIGTMFKKRRTKAPK